jgi:ligand-binding sensor domain-containing protein/signal transduction histidine kinase
LKNKQYISAIDSCFPALRSRCLRVLVALAWLAGLRLAGAQHNQIRFDHFSAEQGIGHKNAYCLMQDRKGYVWIGTRNGLSCYNGYTFESFRHDPEDPYTLSDNHIQALCEDRDGSIWVGTADGGLNRLDRNTGTCTVYKYDPQTGNGIGSNNVCAIHQDRQGNLWVGTFGGGLSKLDPKTGKFKTYYRTEGLPQGLSSNNVISIHEDRAGALWLGTYGGGLCKLVPGEETFTVYGHDAQQPGSIAGNDVYAVHEDRNGFIWAGTNGSGLCRLNVSTGLFKTFRAQPGKPSSLTGDYVHAIEEDQLGYLWVGNVKEGGLHRFDPATETFQSYAYDRLNRSSLGNNNVNAILADRAGTIWVATEGGVDKFEAQSQVFQQFVNNQGGYGTFEAGSVTALLEDGTGITWIGTTAGLYSYHAATDAYTSYDKLLGDRQPNLSGTINALCEDNAGRIWVGTADDGLLVYDKKAGRFRRFASDSFVKNGLTSEGIEAIHKDRQGILWIGTYDGGLCRLDPQTETFTSFRHDPHNPRSIASNALKVIFEDAAGNLWIGTKEAGLSRFDPKTQTFTNYSKDDKESDLTSNSITALTEADGALWVGTFDGGVCRFDSKEETFTPISTLDGLPEDNICGIVKDGKGNLWISTVSKGLVRYSPRTKRMKKFTVAEGLYSNEFQQSAYFRGKGGELFFGGTNHFISFDPAKISDREYAAPVYITGFTLMGEKRQLSQSELVLNHDQNFLEFEFAMLSFLDPARNQYAYTLEGVDKNWNYIGTRRTASYTNLDPNEYVFRVKAADKNGVWNDKGVSVRIVIRPAWYHTWWARTLFVVLFVGSGVAYYKQRIRSVEKQKEVLEMQVLERTAQLLQKNQEIEAINDALESRVEQRTLELKKANESLVGANQELDMFIYRASHDIKGPVATLAGLCKVAALDVTEPKAQEYITMLDRTCEKASQTLVRILSIYEVRNLEAKPQPVSLNELIREITGTIKATPGYEKVKLHLESTATVTLLADPVLLRTILVNLIDNAFRFSKRKDNSFVAVLLTQTANGEVCVQVRDNGMGILPDMRSKLFTMFFRGTVNASGTGLGLYIAKIAAERLNGRIELQPYQPEETVFEAFLPASLQLASPSAESTYVAENAGLI